MDTITQEKQKLMPVKEYAEKNNITTAAVYMAIKRGKLKSRKIGSFTFVIIDN